MKPYQCHKRVQAAKIRAIVDKGDATVTLQFVDESNAAAYPAGSAASIEVDRSYIEKHKPQVGGYFVQYVDGYQSFSPAKAFEDGYAEVVPHDQQPSTADAPSNELSKKLNEKFGLY
jgi:hypothetical protein